VHVTKRIDLALLGRELAAAGVPANGLGQTGTDQDGDVFTYPSDGPGQPIDLPPEARPVVDAHAAPARLLDVAATVDVHAVVRTTDATPLEVFRFPCDQKRLYRADLVISGIDAGNYASKILEGRFTWKRNVAAAILVGLTTVSDIHDAAAAPLAPNVAAQGTDIVFTVTGAAGRTIDWLLAGSVDMFAPSGLE
jgi:hypothetical protein